MDLKQKAGDAISKLFEFYKKALKKRIMITGMIIVIFIVIIITIFGGEDADSSSSSSSSGIDQGVNYTGDIGKEFTKSWENTPLWRYIRGEKEYDSSVEKFITKDKTKYKCYTDYSYDKGDRNFAYGIMFRSPSGSYENNKQNFADLGYPDMSKYAQLGSLIDVNVVDQVFDIEWEAKREAVKRYAKENGVDINKFTSYQLDALTDTAYQGWNATSFFTAYKSGETAVKNYFLVTRGGGARNEKRWQLYSKGIYETRDGEILENNICKTIDHNQIIYEKAKWLTGVLQGNNNQNIQYHYDSIYDNKNIGTSNTVHPMINASTGLPIEGKAVDLADNGISCATFVSEVLYHAGLIKNGETTTWVTSNKTFVETLAKKGVTLIKVSSNDIKPGDIIYTPDPSFESNGQDHVAIIATVNEDTFTKFGSPEAFKTEGAGNAYMPGPYNKSVLNTGVWTVYRAVSSSQGHNKTESIAEMKRTGIAGTYNSYSGKSYILYKQENSSWGATPCWNSNIYNAGCGPSSAAIIISGYGHQEVTPATLCRNHPNYAGAMGSLKNFMTEYGLTVVNGSYSGNTYRGGRLGKEGQKEIVDNLKQENPVLVLVHGSNNSAILSGNPKSAKYTGHYLTLLDINEKGEIFVGDPGSLSWGTDTNGWHTLDELINNTKIDQYLLVKGK